jgi:hypothetical protein
VGHAISAPFCGYDGTFGGDHYREEGGCIDTGICSCCLFEPGYDDNPAAAGEARDSIAASIAVCREKWISAGMPWCGGEVKSPPVGWNPRAQLARLFEAAPFLRE